MRNNKIGLYASFPCLLIVFFYMGIRPVKAQEEITDTNTPLHLIQPDYPFSYGKTNILEISELLDRVHGYLDMVTPMRMLDKNTGEEIRDYGNPGLEAEFEKGDYRLLSYEWGVTYAGMLLAAEATGDPKFRKYTFDRLEFIANLQPYYEKQHKVNQDLNSPLKSVIQPHALDDAGAICAALIKAKEAGLASQVYPMVENFIDFISNREYRLEDGTFARNRPLKNTLWLDDLFMSVPALARMGKYSGDSKYFDDAVFQVLQFSGRMFNPQKGIYMHGWVQGAGVAPQFHWARANGWAFMAMVELLEVLPESHPNRQQVLEYFQAHAAGLASYQSNLGLWHQLLDREDSYLETSATAIFTYAYARAINRGWLDYRVYGPLTLLAWDAVSRKINDKGQVEGTCVGTGMGFDPAFYYHRPVNVYAAHSYGPVILAGAEMINLLKKYAFEINETAVQFLEK